MEKNTKTVYEVYSLFALKSNYAYALREQFFILQFTLVEDLAKPLSKQKPRNLALCIDTHWGNVGD